MFFPISRKMMTRIRRTHVEFHVVFYTLIALCVLLPIKGWAIDQALFATGVNIYGGQTGKSLGGAASSMGYFMHYQAEFRKGRLRPTFGAMLEYGMGTASLSGTSPAFQLYSGTINGGMDFFIFKTDFVKPFIGGGGLFGWANLKLDNNSQGLTYGWYVTAGTEIKRKRTDNAKSLRLSSSYRFLQGRLGETGTVQLNAVQFSIGIVF